MCWERVVTPEQRREAVTYVCQSSALPLHRVCRYLRVQRSLCRYQSRRADDAPLREQLREMAAARPRWGTPRLSWLLRREGQRVNHKRVERVYREEGLSVRSCRRKRIAVTSRSVRIQPAKANERWSMDFMRDTLANGRVFRIFTLVDDFTREPPHRNRFSLAAERVIAALECAAAVRGFPRAITVDNGSEFTSRALDEWAHRRRVKLQFIRPGRPVENAYIESFNGRLRDECLNQHWFPTIADARRLIQEWRTEYNTARPHGGLRGLTPAEFVEKNRTEDSTTTSNPIVRLNCG
jgi:putative transposase